MVVFFRRTHYDSSGYNVNGNILPSPVAIVHAFRESDPITPTTLIGYNEYMVAGVTFTDRGQMNQLDDQQVRRRATVHVGGSVAFCNTGTDAISAGDEVWAQIADKVGKAPITVPRSRVETAAELERAGFLYVGMCVMGCSGSILDIKRLNFGQLVLGSHI